MSRAVRATLLAVAGWALAIAGAGPAAGQTFDLSILDAGKPVADVDIVLLASGGKTTIGTTGADGEAAVPVGLVARGTEMEVYEIECDDEVVVVIVSAAERELLDEECERHREENPDCECRRIGAFVWGGGPVRIDIGERVVQQRRLGGFGGLGGLVVGFGFDGRQMLKLDDVLGLVDGVGEHSATSFAPGVQFFAEYFLWGMVGLGVEAGWSRMDTEARLPTGVQTGELDYVEIGATARIGPWVGDRFRPYAAFGLFRAWNDAEFELGGATEKRDHVTRRDGLGLGFDYWPGNRWGMRAEGLYSSTFEDDDADEHIRWKLGLMYRFVPRVTF